MDFKHSRYMNVKYHWVWNQVKENDTLTVEYIPSKENIADIMTKWLNTTLHGELAYNVIEEYNKVFDPSQDNLVLASSNKDQ